MRGTLWTLFAASLVLLKGLTTVRAGRAKTESAPPVDRTEPKAVLPWPLPLPLGLLPLKVLAVLCLHWDASTFLNAHHEGPADGRYNPTEHHNSTAVVTILVP